MTPPKSKEHMAKECATKIDSKKVEYDGRTFRLIIESEVELLRKLKERQAEIVRDLEKQAEERPNTTPTSALYKHTAGGTLYEEEHFKQGYIAGYTEGETRIWNEAIERAAKEVEEFKQLKLGIDASDIRILKRPEKEEKQDG